MKILTKEEEREHYNATLKGGSIGGALGLGVGFGAVWLASRRYAFFRTLTLPLRAFLVTSAGTFAGIVSADHYSRKYEQERNPLDVQYREREREKAEASSAGKTFTEKAMDFGRRERYKIVAGSWIASMVASFALVNRNPYLTGQQKIVQARVYAQFLTLGVLVASAAFEISDSKSQKGRYETVKYIDPKDPEHKRVLEKQVEATGGMGGEKEDRGGNDLWKEMVAAEEQRINQRKEDEERLRKKHEKKNGNGNGKKKQDKETQKDDQSDKEGEKKENKE